MELGKESSKITVLLVEPLKKPRVVQLGSSLKEMQEAVGGLIEAYMPFEDEVSIICNEEGKTLRLPLNRAVYVDSESGQKQIADIIAGNFFICYAPASSDKLLSLPEKMIEKYEERFRTPEIFVKNGGKIVASPYVG